MIARTERARGIDSKRHRFECASPSQTVLSVRVIIIDRTMYSYQVSESFFLLFINSIKIWGRRDRWLTFFQPFIVVHGRPLKRNQDLILRLLLEESDAVIDLTCDYSIAGCSLSKNDERFGKRRIDLITDDDHKRPVFSLLKYHQATLNVLSMCCMGKNAENQSKVLSLLTFATIVRNILYTDVRPDGNIEAHAAPDALRFVQTPWIGILVDAFLLNNDSQAIGQLHASDEIFQRALGNTSQKKSPIYLTQLFASSMEKLVTRLQAISDAEEYAGNPELLDGHSDGDGDDIGCHLQHVAEIIKACNAFYSRFDTFVTPDMTDTAKIQSQAIRNSATKLYAALSPFRYFKISKSLVELITCMSSQGLSILSLSFLAHSARACVPSHSLSTSCYFC